MKRINLIVAALAVAAFAVPATASASTGLTNPKGELLPAGTVIQGYNSGAWALEGTGWGKFTCNTSTLLGRVAVNNPVQGFEIKEAGATTNGECFQSGSTKTPIDHVVLGNLKSAPNESGAARLNLSYEMHIGTLNCKYNIINGLAMYTSGGHTVTITKQPQTVFPAPCGAAGILTATFNVIAQALPQETVVIR